MKKYYAIKAPVHLDDRESLKVNILAKRLFDSDSEWRRFREQATGHGKGPEWFFDNLDEKVANELKLQLWHIEERKEPACSCGYCYDCHERQLEFFKSNFTEADKAIMGNIDYMNQKIMDLVGQLSESGRKYWEGKNLPACPVA